MFLAASFKWGNTRKITAAFCDGKISSQQNGV
jgi:hypothetical protein